MYTLYIYLRLEGLPNCSISVIAETILIKLGMDMDLPKGYKVMWRNEAVTSSAKIGSPKNGPREAVLRS